MQHHLFSQDHLFSQATAPGTTLPVRLGRLICSFLSARSLAPVPFDPRLLRDIGLLDDLPPREGPEAREAAMQMLRNI
jgi:hypothetical protein